MEQTDLFDSFKQPDGEQPLTVSGGDAGSGPYTVIQADPQILELLMQTAGSSQELLEFLQGQEDGSDAMEYLRLLADRDDTQLLEAIAEVTAANQELLVSSQRLELQMETGISILLIFMVVGLLHYIYKFLRMFF
ncbi:MAG: hypothetical protein NC305_12785 [Lachnospiraceae bacterium]|nr:hypothetical protein [Lachnospiraceae bacterium]